MRVLRVVVGMLSLVIASTSLTALSAEAQTYVLPKDAKRIEAAMSRLGLPVGKVDGIWDNDTARATCAWRELTGRDVWRGWPVVAERPSVKATTALTPTSAMRVGMNINIACQTGIWVDSALVETSSVRTRTVVITLPPDTSTVTDTATASETGTVTGETTTVVETYTVTKLVRERQVLRVVPVSTGRVGVYDTHLGSFRVQWAVDKWWQSTIYTDGLMYRPFFFNGGQALHGSITDALVMWYPASHGCVRMLHKDIDALWKAGFGRGDRVYVYGTWKS